MTGIFGGKRIVVQQPSLPQLLAPPAAPPVASTAADVTPEPIVDVLAKKRKAFSRQAKEREDKLVMALSDKAKTAVTLTNQLLGD